MLTVEPAPAAATAATAVFQSAWLATSIAIAWVANRLPAQISDQANQRDTRRDATTGTKAVVWSNESVRTMELPVLEAERPVENDISLFRLPIAMIATCNACEVRLPFPIPIAHGISACTKETRVPSYRQTERGNVRPPGTIVFEVWQTDH